MKSSSLRLVLWLGGAANQKALACKIAAEFNVAGIVIDQRNGHNRRESVGGMIRKIIDRLRFKTIYDSWKNLMGFYQRQYPAWPEVPLLRVPINSGEALEFSANLHPDLIVVSGTALVREPMLSCPARLGIINLHTGLSPYVKGAPNCTNWCIANNRFDLVGNTIMWINAGIDTGNLITTETIDILPERDLDSAHVKVMEHAHALYLRAIRYLLEHEPPYNSIDQSSIAKGELYLTKMWTATKRKQLLQNWSKRRLFKPGQLPVTIPLPVTHSKS